MLKTVVKRLFPSLYNKYWFYKRRHYWPNLENPTHITEFILQLKLNSSPDIWHLVDKLTAQEHIRKIAEENGLDLRFAEISTIFESPDQVNLTDLTEDWFIKANHGSGMGFLFSPLSGESHRQALAEICSWFEIDFAARTGERCYQGIKPKVFLEKPLRCKDGSLPDDIKVHCYFGMPKVVQVLRRTGEALERKTFNEHWEERQWFQNETLHVDLDNIPQENALHFAQVLAAGFDYVRVDFYNVDGVLYFSEMTFFPASSALPLASKQVDEYLGGVYRQLKDAR